MAILPINQTRGWNLVLAAGLAALTAACATAPRPVPVAVPVHVPMPPPRPAPPPPPADWRDAAQTPGDWRWFAASGTSQARYGAAGAAPLVTLICDRTARMVMLERAGEATGSVPITVRTTFSLRLLSSDPAISRPGWITMRLAPRDPLLDAIAFSRGRFTIEVAGLTPLYLPSWPEISRVIEDCR